MVISQCPARATVKLNHFFLSPSDDCGQYCCPTRIVRFAYVTSQPKLSFGHFSPVVFVGFHVIRVNSFQIYPIQNTIERDFVFSTFGSIGSLDISRTHLLTVLQGFDNVPTASSRLGRRANKTVSVCVSVCSFREIPYDVFYSYFGFCSFLEHWNPGHSSNNNDHVSINLTYER